MLQEQAKSAATSQTTLPQEKQLVNIQDEEYVEDDYISHGHQRDDIEESPPVPPKSPNFSRPRSRSSSTSSRQPPSPAPRDQRGRPRPRPLRVDFSSHHQPLASPTVGPRSPYSDASYHSRTGSDDALISAGLTPVTPFFSRHYHEPIAEEGQSQYNMHPKSSRTAYTPTRSAHPPFPKPSRPRRFFGEDIVIPRAREPATPYSPSSATFVPYSPLSPTTPGIIPYTPVLPSKRGGNRKAPKELVKSDEEMWD
jgi:hypothetical protein